MIDIDQLGRRAGSRLRSTDVEHDIDARFDDLVRTVRRRRRVKLTGAVAALALILGGLGWSASNLNQAETPAPTDRGRVDAGTGEPYTSSGDACALDIVTCTGPALSRATFRMAVPMTWQRPANVRPLMNVRSNESGSRAVSVDANRKDAVAGVVVSLPVRPVTAEGADTDPPIGAGALAQWIADRPGIAASPVTRGALDDLPTWSVQIRLTSPETTGRCSDDGDRCLPLLWAVGDRSYPAQFLFEGMVGQVTLLNLPGAGTVSIWSWSFDGADTLPANEKLIQSIHFHR